MWDDVAAGQELVDYQAIKRVYFTCCDMHECPQIHEIKKSWG